MTDRDPLVDGDDLLALTAALGEARSRVEEADVSEERRERWRRTIGAIASGASEDLAKAREQLHRFLGQLDRHRGA